MTRYVLDNNHLGAAVSRVSSVRERIWQYHRAGHRLGTCVPVLCELEVGIQQTKDPEAYRRRLGHLLTQVRLWPLEESITRAYGQVYRELERVGRVLSQVDMILAALARLMNLTILTSDRDFEALPDIRTENWLGEA
jgi:tRNA(fMet)-specific endonuclease VapC